MRRTLHGAINVATGPHHHVSVMGVVVVCCYVPRQLLDAYPDAPVVAVICNDGTTHHGGITKRWLADHPHLHLTEGARYRHTTTK